MGSKFAFAWVFSLLSLLVWVTVADHEGKPKFFNVMEYGAVADGATDNSEVIGRAWFPLLTQMQLFDVCTLFEGISQGMEGRM